MIYCLRHTQFVSDVSELSKSTPHNVILICPAGLWPPQFMFSADHSCKLQALGLLEGNLYVEDTK
jgi:hypothetical protein